MRLAVIEDNLEVDLSPIYFNYQIKGLLEKEKTLTVKAFMFDSPGLPPSYAERNSVNDTSSINIAASQQVRKVRTNSRAKRSLTLAGDQNDLLYDTNDNDSDSNVSANHQKTRVYYFLWRDTLKSNNKPRVILNVR